MGKAVSSLVGGALGGGRGGASGTRDREGGFKGGGHGVLLWCAACFVLLLLVQDIREGGGESCGACVGDSCDL